MDKIRFFYSSYVYASMENNVLFDLGSEQKCIWTKLSWNWRYGLFGLRSFGKHSCETDSDANLVQTIRTIGLWRECGRANAINESTNRNRQMETMDDKGVWKREANIQDSGRKGEMVYMHLIVQQTIAIGHVFIWQPSRSCIETRPMWPNQKHVK